MGVVSLPRSYCRVCREDRPFEGGECIICDSSINTTTSRGKSLGPLDVTTWDPKLAGKRTRWTVFWDWSWFRGRHA